MRTRGFSIGLVGLMILALSCTWLIGQKPLVGHLTLESMNLLVGGPEGGGTCMQCIHKRCNYTDTGCGCISIPGLQDPGTCIGHTYIDYNPNVTDFRQCEGTGTSNCLTYSGPYVCHTDYPCDTSYIYLNYTCDGYTYSQCKFQSNYSCKNCSKGSPGTDYTVVDWDC